MGPCHARVVDPIAHTLVGATLAESGLKRHTPLATAALVLGANAPDIDILAQIGGADAGLALRRGHTHGVLAMLALPLVLTGLLLAWDRGVRLRRHPERPPAGARPLLLLTLGATLTHPLLDWLNTYGVRLLMPFDGRWFYGDSLFIVDPWLWLLMAAAVVLAHSRGKPSAGAWLVLGLATSALVTLTDLVPLGVKIGWLLGVLTIIALRLRGAEQRARAIAGRCLLALVLYIGSMVIASRRAVANVDGWLHTQQIHATVLAADPQPGNPFRRVVIAKAGEHYYFVERSWLPASTLRFDRPPLPVGPRDGPAAAALALDALQGFRAWLRFPSVVVEPIDGGYKVTIRDARYARLEGARIGTQIVELDRELRPLRVYAP